MLCHVRLFATPWTTACQASLFITNSWSLLKLMSIESVMPSNHHILCQSLLLLPSIFPSIRVFSNKSVLHIRLPKYWSFSFSISSSNEYSGLISFRIDQLDILAVQGTHKSLLQQFKSINSSAFSFFFSLTEPVNTFILFLKFKFIYFNWRLITLQYCIGFAIRQHESATGIHLFKCVSSSHQVAKVLEFQLQH